MAVVSMTGKKRDDYEERDQLVQIGKNQFVTKPGSQSRGKATAEVTPDQYLDRLDQYGLTDTAYQRSGNSPYTGNGGKPGYSSRYSSQIDALLDSVLNREGFSYDVESDPLYQQYRKQYIREGDRAMRDTMGNAAALTGGYGSSYGTTAGSQAYDYYLSQLNDRVPELEQLAYQKYQDEGTALLNRLSAIQAMEDQDYSRYRDQINDYYTDQTFNYQKEQDALSQKNWQAQFDYQKEQDALSQKNWLMQYNASLSKSSGSGKSSGKAGSSHSEMYSSVLKRAEKQVDAGKKSDAEIAEYILGQNITDEEAYDILTYLGLMGALEQPRKASSGKSGSGRGLSGSGSKNTMRVY